MKPLIALCLSVSLLGAFTGTTSAQTKKYDIKSGILTLDIAVNISGMNLTKKAIVYFDDYGMKECRENYSGEKPAESLICDGKTIYLVKHSAKTAYKQGDGRPGTELRFDHNELPQKDKDAEHLKMLPDVVIAGKTCASYVMQGTSEKTVFAGWGHIMFLIDLDGASMKSTTKVTSIKENVSIPPEKFAIPAGYQVKNALF